MLDTPHTVNWRTEPEMETGQPAGAGSPAIRTAARVPDGCGRRHSCRRHPYSWLGWIPASRAIADTPAPGRHQPLLLHRAPASATLHRSDDFNRGRAHVTIPMNSHMTHTPASSTRRPSPDAYGAHSVSEGTQLCKKGEVMRIRRHAARKVKW
jgi:hypothetical protein